MLQKDIIGKNVGRDDKWIWIGESFHCIVLRFSSDIPDAKL